MKVGLFGGAFNPPHRAHASIARTALEQLPIQLLLVVPSGRHPFKTEGDLAPAAARLELCRLAFENLDPRIRVDDREVRRPGPAYTIDTVEEVAAEHGEPPWLLIGADNVSELPTWRRWQDLMRQARLAVFPRPGHPIDPEAIDRLGAREVRVLELTPDPVSASEIRNRVRRGESIEGLVAPTVAARIRELGLFSGDR